MAENKQPSIKASSYQPDLASGAKPTSPAKARKEPVAGTPVTGKKATTPAGKKPAGKKATPAAEKASPAPNAPAPNSTSGPASAHAPTRRLSADERDQMITRAAYLISLKRHPDLHGPDADWLYAETVIDMIFETTG